MNLRCVGIVRSGGMPLLLLCLPACFHRDVSADVSELRLIDFMIWKYEQLENVK